MKRHWYEQRGKKRRMFDIEDDLETRAREEEEEYQAYLAEQEAIEREMEEEYQDDLAEQAYEPDRDTDDEYKTDWNKVAQDVFDEFLDMLYEEGGDYEKFGM